MSGEIRPAIGDFPAGARIATYQIEQLIGRGGMAVVYRATDVRLDRLVALKILAPELARNDAFRQRFIHESRSGAAVDHPNVVPVFEAGEADGVLFIAMRYVAGQDVRALIERTGKLPDARVVRIVTQVASALDAAHAYGLVHRDVKPANMLLAAASDSTAPDHVYLSDFGLSKLSVSTASLTGTGQFLGTLDYMPPEQVEGKPVDGRADQYALACAAFEMLAAEPPFRREQNLAVMWAQISAPAPSVRLWRPELPAEVDQVFARALAKAPADRYASCLEFAQALRSAFTARSAGAPGPAVPGVPGRPAGAGNPGGPGRPATELAYGLAAGAPQDVTVTKAAGPAVTGPGGPGYVPTSAGGVGYGSSGPGGPGYAPGGSGYGAGGPGYAPGGPGYSAGGQGYSAGGQGYSAGGQGYGPSGPGYGPSGPDYSPSGPGYQPSLQPKPPRRGKALPVLVGCLIVAVLVGAALIVLHLRNIGASKQAGPPPSVTKTVTGSPSASSSPSVTTQPPPPPVTPRGVVSAYYNAINDHQYRTAWQLNSEIQSQETYTSFKQGFDATQSDDLTIVSVSGDVVSIRLVANQTNGTVKTFDGTYTVQNGAIVGSSIQQIS